MMQDIDWYVLYTKPRSEKKAALDLSEQGYHTYCPVMKTMRQWSDRKKMVIQPMFPSYIFVEISAKQRGEVLQHPGILNYVFWLGKPAVVKKAEIDAIRQIEQHGQNIQVAPLELRIGETLKIDKGLFKGMTGVVESTDKNKVTLYIDRLAMKISFSLDKSLKANDE